MESINKSWNGQSCEKHYKCDVKWIYRNKRESEYQAKLVVQSLQQTDSTADTYSLVTKMPTSKLILFCLKFMQCNQLVMKMVPIESINYTNHYENLEL